jgi:hypothetical protein
LALEGRRTKVTHAISAHDEILQRLPRPTGAGMLLIEFCGRLQNEPERDAIVYWHEVTDVTETPSQLIFANGANQTMEAERPWRIPGNLGASGKRGE